MKQTTICRDCHDADDMPIMTNLFGRCPKCHGTGRTAKPTDHLGRDAKDFAIEFGEYLAIAADRMIEELCRETQEHDGVNADVFRGLQSAIYEFRKRAERTKI